MYLYLYAAKTILSDFSRIEVIVSNITYYTRMYYCWYEYNSITMYYEKYYDLEQSIESRVAVLYYKL